MPTASLDVSSTAIRLSETLLLTVSIEGSKPLRVEPPTVLLDTNSAAQWKIEPVGTPQVRDVVWQQSYRLSPFAIGEQVPIQFKPFQVNDSQLTLPVHSIRVVTTIADVKATQIRPLTGIEQIPAAPKPASLLLPLLALVSVLALVSAARLGILLLRRKPAVSQTPQQWLEAELTGLTARPAHVRLAGVVALWRSALQHHCQIRTEQATTSEWLAEIDRRGLGTAKERIEHRRLIEVLDRLRFTQDEFQLSQIEQAEHELKAYFQSWCPPRVSKVSWLHNRYIGFNTN